MLYKSHKYTYILSPYFQSSYIAVVVLFTMAKSYDKNKFKIIFQLWNILGINKMMFFI